MALSKKSAEALLDLVEIKLSCIQVYDREDAREVKKLEQCRKEILELFGKSKAAQNAEIIPIDRRIPPEARARAI
ncbi:MAG: hypothetical protein ACKVJQ_07850 [Alphaproteobacteria bacterium]|jgi:hypothetical protein